MLLPQKLIIRNFIQSLKILRFYGSKFNELSDQIWLQIYHVFNINIMCSQLRDIYDKKSPIFLAEIAMLITTLILFFKYPCTCFPPLPTFYKLVISVSGSEIIMKTVIISIIYCISRDYATLAQTLFTILYLLGHISLWVYGIVLFHNPQMSKCLFQEPHYFYLYCYVVLYSVVIIGSLAVMIGMLIPATVLTVFKIKSPS